jgi:hypothetical protein
MQLPVNPVGIQEETVFFPGNLSIAIEINDIEEKFCKGQPIFGSLRFCGV